MMRTWGRVGMFASSNVSWSKYDRAPVKWEFVDDGNPRWVLALWVSRFGVCFHWHKAREAVSNGKREKGATHERKDEAESRRPLGRQRLAALVKAVEQLPKMKGRE